MAAAEDPQDTQSEPGEAQGGLHSDTTDWLEVRNEERTTLSGGYLPAAAGAAAAAGCAEVGGCADINNQFAGYPLEEGVEQQEAAKGWPEAEGLYGDVNSNLKNENKSMAEILVQERQINTLESYRRMLLHKKERRCHLLAAYAEYWGQEGLSQSELEQQMLAKLVGQQGNAGA